MMNFWRFLARRNETDAGSLSRSRPDAMSVYRRASTTALPVRRIPVRSHYHIAFARPANWSDRRRRLGEGRCSPRRLLVLEARLIID